MTTPWLTERHGYDPTFALDVKVLDRFGDEVDLKENFDNDDIGLPVATDEELVADNMDGFTMQDEEGNDITEETDEYADDYGTEEYVYEQDNFDDQDNY